MKICVVALPRSGSSVFCRYLAETHKLKNSGEILRNEDAGLDIVKRDNSVFKLVPQNIRSTLLDQILTEKFKNLPKYIAEMKKATIVNNTSKKFLLAQEYDQEISSLAFSVSEQIIKEAGKVYFICRRDLRNQILSFAALLQTGKAGKNREKHVYINNTSLKLSIDYTFKISGFPLYKKLYQSFGGEIVYTEDLCDIVGAPPYPKVIYDYDETLLSGLEYFDLASSGNL